MAPGIRGGMQVYSQRDLQRRADPYSAWNIHNTRDAEQRRRMEEDRQDRRGLNNAAAMQAIMNGNARSQASRMADAPGIPGFGGGVPSFPGLPTSVGQPGGGIQPGGATSAQDPSKGARERALRAQIAASQAATTAAGAALASGSFGSSRAANQGMAQLQAQGAAQGTLAGDQMIESDLERQQQSSLQNTAIASDLQKFFFEQAMEQWRRKYTPPAKW